MITLLASIAGFISSIIPEILKFFKDKNDKKHELDILSMQMKQAKTPNTKELTEIEAPYDFFEKATLYSTYRSGINWVDALNGTVRPVLAYSFFIIYGAVKLMQYRTLSNAAPYIAHIDLIWSADDQAIFASIISFYFGQRTFARIWKK